MSLLIYITLGLLIGGFEVFRRKTYLFDGIFFANANFFLFYVLTPISLIAIPDWQSKVGVFGIYDVDLSRTDLAVSCLIGYLSLLFGWISGGFIKVTPFFFRNSKKWLQKLVLTGLAVGIMAYFAYAFSMGGVWNSILHGSLIRYQGVDAELLLLGGGQVFRHFLLSLDLVFLYHVARVFEGESLNRQSKMIFFFSGMFLLLYLLSASSRGAVVGLLLAIFALRAYKFHSPKQASLSLLKNRRIAYVIPSAILIILYGKQFFWAFPTLLSGGVNGFIVEFVAMQEMRSVGDTNFFRDSLLKEASHGIVSLAAAIDYFVDRYDYLWFRDFWLMPLHILPANLLGLTIEAPPTVSAINTEIIQGQLIASIPPAVLAMLTYNSGVLGIPLLFLYGVAGKVIQRKFIKTPVSPARNLFLFYFAYLYGSFIGNADVKVFVYSAFPLVILIVILYARKSMVLVRV